MTLAERLTNVKQSELFKLVYNGKVLGLRAKFFDVNTEKFVYYDFSLDIIHNKGMIQFVKSIKGMRSIPMIAGASGLLVTQDEIENKLLVQEFETEAEALLVLEPIKAVYEVRG